MSEVKHSLILSLLTCSNILVLDIITQNCDCYMQLDQIICKSS